jgi:hypothetical protein
MTIWEATEIELHPDNMNKQDGFSLSRSCGSRVYSLKEWKKNALSKDKTTTSLETTLLYSGPQKRLSLYFPPPIYARTSKSPYNLTYPSPTRGGK